MSLARGANSEGKERVEGNVSRIQISRIGSVLVCVRRNTQHLELNILESTRFVLNNVVIVSVATCGPTVAHYVFLHSRPNTYSHTENTTHTIGPGVKHQPLVLHWAQIVRAGKGSRLKLVGYKLSESGLRSCVYVGTYNNVS